MNRRTFLKATAATLVAGTTAGVCYGYAEAGGFQVTCPTLVIGTENDRLTPAGVVRKIAKRYAHAAEHREFPGQGHWVVGQPGWQEIAAYTADWIERALAPAARTRLRRLSMSRMRGTFSSVTGWSVSSAAQT